MVYRPRYLKCSQIPAYQLMTNVQVFIKFEKKISNI